MTLDFINVGYGDAILIRSGSSTMLVDCGDWTVGDGGPDSQRISAADFLRQEGIETLDLLVLTHLHRDHSGGLTKLLECVAVRSFRCNYLPDRIFWGKRVPVPEGVFRRSQMPAGISECILKRTCDYGTAGNRGFSCVPRHVAADTGTDGRMLLGSAAYF